MESRAPTLSAISSCSVSGSAGVKEGVGRNSLLSMQGRISGLPAVILNDCGASHNFISGSWVERHELKTEQLSTPLGVKLAESSPLRQVNFRTEVLPISVAPCSFTQSFAEIDMDGFDALLGKEWLSDCNPRIDFVTHHVQLQNRSFIADGKCFPSGLPDQREGTASLHFISGRLASKSLRKGCQGILCWLEQIADTDSEQTRTLSIQVEGERKEQVKDFFEKRTVFQTTSQQGRLLFVRLITRSI